MRTLWTLAAVLVLLAAAGNPSLAQQEPAPAADRPDPMVLSTEEVAGLKTLDDSLVDVSHQGKSVPDMEGTDVVNISGARIGAIEQVLGEDTDSIAAVVVRVEEDWRPAGQTEHHIVIPIEALELSQDGERFVAALTAQELAAAPSWKPD